MKKFIFSSFLILASASALYAATANDPFFAKQWSLSNDGSQTVEIDADDLHTILQKGKAGVDIGWSDAQTAITAQAKSHVVVAVIDTGLDAGHPDLVGRVAPGAYDFLLNFPIVTDKVGHGTHVSGIIAANGNNGVGISGITPNTVQILPLTVLWADNDPHAQRFAYLDPTSSKTAPKYKLVSDFAADAIRYAVAHGASIINMSFGWPKIVDTANVRAAVQDAASAGVLIVVSAGNDRKDQATYPCSYENVLCVGSITNTGDMSIYSNYGGLVDVLAPGDGIISTFPQQLESTTLRIQGYEMLSGTSQATPHISGVAAILKSINPNMSLNELKARLLLSAVAPPSSGSALYGLVNLPNAINAQAQPVYLPDFKGIDEIIVDESSLKTSGQLSIQNLWQDAANVNISLSINGVVSGTIQTPSLTQGSKISLPWTYQFDSMDSSSSMQMVLTIQDSTQTKNFSFSASAVRDMNLMSGKKSFAVPGVKSTDWITTQNGHPFSLVNIVDNYPKTNGLPRYYQQIAYGDAGSQLLIYDPSTSELVHQVQVFGIKNIKQVIHTNAGWIITGLDQAANSTQNPSFWEFYFLDANFNPQYGSVAASEWQISLGTGQNVIRSFSGAGSWLSANGQLVPCFLGNGSLPPKDNFGELDIRHYQGTTHLFYLIPSTPVTSAATQPIQLEIRALDSASFRTQNPNANLLNIIPIDPASAAKGEVRVLLNQGNTLSAPTQVWDIQNTLSATLTPSPGWDSLAASGTPAPANTGNPNIISNVFVNFFDSSHGSLAWADNQGSFIDSTRFNFQSPENPVTGLTGAFNLTGIGRYWFLETGFDLVAYFQGEKVSELVTKSIPIERDSSFASQDFSQMLTPITVGNMANPIPGIYIDSTLVRGNEVGIVVWNQDGNLLKPLRYSMRIPDGCLEMNPIQQSDGSFGLPLLCSTSSGGVEFDLIAP